MRSRYVFAAPWSVVLRTALWALPLLTVSCQDEPPHPNQQVVDWSKKQAEESTQKAEAAVQEARHQQRLRDIDKAKFDAQAAEMQTAWSFWRLWLIALAILLVIVVIWLAPEIRFRRVLAHVLLCIRRQQQEGGEA